jgi:hypothetical protein
MTIDLANARATLQWQGISVGVVALVASAALVFANALTQGPIAEAEARDLQASLAQVLPEGFADNDLLKDTVELARRRRREEARLSGEEERQRSRRRVPQFGARLFGRHRGADGGRRRGRTLGVRVVKHTPKRRAWATRSNWRQGDWITGLRRQVAGQSCRREMGGQKGRRRLRPVCRRHHHAACRGQGGQGRARVLRRPSRRNPGRS